MNKLPVFKISFQTMSKFLLWRKILRSGNDWQLNGRPLNNYRNSQFLLALIATLWLQISCMSWPLHNGLMEKLFRHFHYSNISPFAPIAPFSTPWKHQQTVKVFWCFQEVEKRCRGNEWVNMTSVRNFIKKLIF